MTEEMQVIGSTSKTFSDTALLCMLTLNRDPEIRCRLHYKFQKAIADVKKAGTPEEICSAKEHAEQVRLEVAQTLNVEHHILTRKEEPRSRFFEGFGHI